MTWLFAYAELMGEHDLRECDAQPARLSGYQRVFLHASTLLWGTPEHPCPIVGLAPGGECWGLAFKASWSGRRRLLKRLEPTEQGHEYHRVRLPVDLGSGRNQRALVWVSRPEVARAARWSDRDALEQALLEAHGTAGRGVEYIRTLVHALQLWGLHDPMIESVWPGLASWRPR